MQSIEKNYIVNKKEAKKSMEELGKKIKVLRIKSNLTQSELAEKLGISASSVGMYEQGRREPNSNILAKICVKLNASGDYILGISKSQVSSTDILKSIEEFSQNIIENENITLNGRIMSKKDKEKFFNTIKLACAVNTPPNNY